MDCGCGLWVCPRVIAGCGKLWMVKAGARFSSQKIAFLDADTRLYKPLFGLSVRKSVRPSQNSFLTFSTLAHPSATNAADYTALLILTGHSVIRYIPSLALLTLHICCAVLFSAILVLLACSMHGLANSLISLPCGGRNFLICVYAENAFGGIERVFCLP